MTTPPPDYLADLFGLPPAPPASPESTAEAEAAEAALVAAEAALAAEFAGSIDPTGAASDAPDSRASRRVRVSWPARMRLPAGRVVDVEVRNISETGVGLMSDEDIQAGIAVGFEMRVPRQDDGTRATTVTGTIRTTYTVAHAAKFLCGGTWEGAPEGVEHVDEWIARLRG